MACPGAQALARAEEGADVYIRPTKGESSSEVSESVMLSLPSLSAAPLSGVAAARTGGAGPVGEGVPALLRQLV